jgi:(1->4)-alpha-D-glucan 1-alpha-D-glucosylmutase
VEKILAEHENLRRDWPVDGTTGYEFTNLVNGLFVDPEGEQGFDRIYGEFIGEKLDFDQLLRDAKRQIIEELFPGDLTRLAVGLARIAVRHWRSREFNSDRMRKALREIVVHFPVYRTYVTQQAVTAEDRREIEHAVIQAKRRDHADEAEVYDFLHRLLTGELPAENPAYGRAETADLVLRVQQFTAPITAKSLEDTAFYRYVRLVSLNEVGGDPRVFGISIADFHRRMADRRRRWPHSLLATATHDTKRGEDVRVRIDALSEIPETWGERLARWSSINSFAHQTLADGDAPSRNDEYLIYQTLLGAWPIEATELGSTNTETIRAFADRVKQYLVKALREAKQRTSWLRPNAAYEDACLAFVDQVLDNSGHNPFLEDFATLQPRIARLGALNGLSQTVLKLTVPGVPDIYQGCELWDFNLVDPDNRRPVAFDRRRQLLQELAANAKHPNTERGAPLTQLCAHWHDGRIKLHVIAQILAARRRLPDLFADGSYEPLRVTGPAARHVVAFARRCHGDTMIVVVGRLFAELAEAAGELCPKPEAWRDTVLTGPSRSASFTDILSGETVEPKPGGAFDVEKLFRQLPVAVLITAAPPEGTGPTSDLLPWN